MIAKVKHKQKEGGGMKLSNQAKKAFLIGSLCAISYLAVYVAKGILSAATPQITLDSAFTTEQIGTLSSVFFIAYAVGQLINGYIGDKVKAKYMIALGLILSSIGLLLLPHLTDLPNYAYIAYSSTGFFSAMIYAPMTKVVAENTEPIYATRCSIGYTLASFLGSPTAGILAALLAWQWAFRGTGFILVLMGIAVLISFTAMEKKGVVKYGQFVRKKSEGGSIKLLLKRKIVKYTLVAILTGVVRTTVVFWMPTYIAEHLKFSPDTAALIFTVASLAFSFSAIVAAPIYQWLKRDMDLTVLVGFSAAAVFFLLVYIVPDPMVNVICLSLGIMANNVATSILWSWYCPSLYDTGMVSTVTGFVDACSYAAASLSSTLFANAVGIIGWGNLILIWMGLMVCGVVVSLPWKKRQKILA